MTQNNYVVSKIIKEALLNNKQEYIKSGFVSFDEIKIAANKVELYKSGNKIVIINQPVAFDTGDTLTFKIYEGTIKMLLE